MLARGRLLIEGRGEGSQLELSVAASPTKRTHAPKKNGFIDRREKATAFFLVQELFANYLVLTLSRDRGIHYRIHP